MFLLVLIMRNARNRHRKLMLLGTVASSLVLPGMGASWGWKTNYLCRFTLKLDDSQKVVVVVLVVVVLYTCPPVIQDIHPPSRTPTYFPGHPLAFQDTQVHYRTSTRLPAHPTTFQDTVLTYRTSIRTPGQAPVFQDTHPLTLWGTHLLLMIPVHPVGHSPSHLDTKLPYRTSNLAQGYAFVIQNVRLLFKTPTHHPGHIKDTFIISWTPEYHPQTRFTL